MSCTAFQAFQALLLLLLAPTNENEIVEVAQQSFKLCPNRRPASEQAASCGGDPPKDSWSVLCPAPPSDCICNGCRILILSHVWGDSECLKMFETYWSIGTTPDSKLNRFATQAKPSCCPGLGPCLPSRWWADHEEPLCCSWNSMM